LNIAGGACNLQIVTQGGTTNTAGWTFNANEWYWVDTYYSNNSATSHTFKLYTATPVTGSSCTSGTETLTTAGLPADGNITTGKSVYVKNVGTQTSWQGPYTVTVSGNNVSYSQTCPDPGYASSSYIVAQVGTTLSGTAQSVNWISIFFGAFSALPSGGHEYFDSWVVNFSGLDPLLP
jgi:hypothetical protein